MGTHPEPLSPETVFLQRLRANKSDLFEEGHPDDATSDMGFVKRVNGLLALETRMLDLQHKKLQGALKLSNRSRSRLPADLTAAIGSRGELKTYGELIAFGHWLFLDNMPGVPPTGGRKVNPRTLLKTVAAALLIHAKPGTGGCRKIRITKKTLSENWSRLFRVTAKHSDFDARIKTMRRLVPAYLTHIKNRRFSPGGKLVTRAPRIKAIAASLDATRSAPPSAPQAQVPISQPVALSPATHTVAAALPAGFTFFLTYSSPATETEYRQRSTGALGQAELVYRVEPLQASEPGAKIRADRRNSLVLTPDLALRKNFRTVALIDRMVVLLDTRRTTSSAHIKKLLNAGAGRDAYVQDRTRCPAGNATDWRLCLPPLDPAKTAGQHFAILLQDPTPEALRETLDVIDANCRITGQPSLFLVELSLDFYPRSDKSPDQCLLLREQLVGALQRHQWCSPAAIAGITAYSPSHSDARQVYPDPKTGKGRPHFFFSKRAQSRTMSDTQLDVELVRTRILGAGRGKGLHLDATIYQGAAHAELMISVQHKIADRRNPARQTSMKLPEPERRGRVELTILGEEKLRAYGITGVNDLGKIDFRNMRRNMLHFRLPICQHDAAALEDTKTQLQSRGVYGVDLAARARAIEALGGSRRARQPLKVPREGLSLVDWAEANDAAGQALDRLQRQWRGFSWR